MGAVTARNTLLPNETSWNPLAIANLISASVQPPSGPMAIAISPVIKFSDMAVPTVRPLPNLALGKMGSWSLSRI